DPLLTDAAGMQQGWSVRLPRPAVRRG
ncbi:hypothetical protein AAIH64_22670, partial [Pseudomonas aeruginosa]